MCREVRNKVRNLSICMYTRGNSGKRGEKPRESRSLEILVPLAKPAFLGYPRHGEDKNRVLRSTGAHRVVVEHVHAQIEIDRQIDKQRQRQVDEKREVARCKIDRRVRLFARRTGISMRPWFRHGGTFIPFQQPKSRTVRRLGLKSPSLFPRAPLLPPFLLLSQQFALSAGTRREFSSGIYAARNFGLASLQISKDRHLIGFIERELRRLFMLTLDVYF